MSMTINIGPMIAKVVRDLATSENMILDVDAVYDRMTSQYGDDLFQSERLLAQVAIRQKIKAHLKSAFSVNGDVDGGDQLRLLKDDVPAALAVKQADGGYTYVPLRLATLDDLDAVTKSKAENVKNVQASLKRWNKTTKPIRSLIMDGKASTVGEAQKILAEQPKAQTKERKSKVAKA